MLNTFKISLVESILLPYRHVSFVFQQICRVISEFSSKIPSKDLSSLIQKFVPENLDFLQLEEDQHPENPKKRQKRERKLEESKRKVVEHLENVAEKVCLRLTESQCPSLHTFLQKYSTPEFIEQKLNKFVQQVSSPLNLGQSANARRLMSSKPSPTPLSKSSPHNLQVSSPYSSSPSVLTPERKSPSVRTISPSSSAEVLPRIPPQKEEEGTYSPQSSPRSTDNSGQQSFDTMPMDQEKPVSPQSTNN